MKARDSYLRFPYFRPSSPVYFSVITSSSNTLKGIDVELCRIMLRFKLQALEKAQDVFRSGGNLSRFSRKIALSAV